MSMVMWGMIGEGDLMRDRLVQQATQEEKGYRSLNSTIAVITKSRGEENRVQSNSMFDIQFIKYDK
jgi:hypothetical protein